MSTNNSAVLLSSLEMKAKLLSKEHDYEIVYERKKNKVLPNNDNDNNNDIMKTKHISTHRLFFCS